MKKKIVQHTGSIFFFEFKEKCERPIIVKKFGKTLEI
jgi:hypothetical protein